MSNIKTLFLEVIDSYVRAVAVLSIVAIFIFGIIVLVQFNKDLKADKISSVIAREIKLAGQEFENVTAGGISNWHNHKPSNATIIDMAWNSMYPTIGGSVPTKNSFLKLNNLLRQVCEKNDFNFNLIASFVKVSNSG